jgi:hypothetical protein
MELEGDLIVFKGGTTTLVDGQPGFEIGNFISDQYFGGGIIRATIQFSERHVHSAAGLILHYHPKLAGFIEAQLGGPFLCSLHTWGGQKWVNHGAIGSADQLQSGVPYEFEVRVMGSRVEISLNGVRALEANLPYSLPRGQAGIWAMGPTDIKFSDFTVTAEKPKLFVIMQFSAPFNELYSDVIQPVGTEAGFIVVRADELYGPGLIIADLEQQILEAKAIIADITPNNPNVYWEVGYAHAVRKPTVLIAERDTELPFDVSPFRTLLYEDTIAGKARIEEGLHKHLVAIQTEWGGG